MSTLSRLAPPATDPLLGQFVLAGRTWWLLRDGSEERVGNAMAELVADESKPAQRRWVVELRGARRKVAYVGDTLTAQPAAVDGSRVVLGPLGADEVIDVLDRAETVHVGVLLIQVDDAEVMATLEALGQPAGPLPPGRVPADQLQVDQGAADHLQAARVAPGQAALSPALLGMARLGSVPLRTARLVVSVDGHRGWAVIGVLHDETAPVARAQVLPEAVSLPAAGLRAEAAHRSPGESPHRRLRVVAALAAAACLVGAGSWLAQRGAGRQAPRPRSPGVSTVPVATTPAPRYSPALAYDPANNAVLLFGGGQAAATTWQWARQQWTAAVTTASPTDRFGSAIAYDPLLKRVLLFGGRELGGDVPNDTWAWDGHSWGRLAASGSGPLGYESSGMAWDDARQQMVLVTPTSGGALTPVATWTWSGQGWTAHASATAPPTASSTLAFDPATRTVLLVTTESSAAGSPVVTWSWDGATWRDLHPHHAPTSTGATFLSAVPGHRQLILASISSSFGEIPKTWTWDGQDWTERYAVPAPGGIVGMVADEQAGAVIAFGGAPGSGPLNRAWAWIGSQWVGLVSNSTGAVRAVHGQHLPPRQNASTAYDERNRQLVLFGGNLDAAVAFPGTPTAGPVSPPPNTETWLFDGQSWARPPTTTHPPSQGPMAFDPATGSVLLVADANQAGGTGAGGTAAGGAAGTSLPRPLTWSWDGHTWRQLHADPELPPGTRPTAMVGSPRTGTLVAVTIEYRDASAGQGPPVSQSTWVWNGHGWVNPHPLAQPLYLGGALDLRLAYDRASGRVLAVVDDGNTTGAGATWAWDGATWTQLHPAHDVVVDPRSALLAGEPATGTVVLLERPQPDPATGADAGGSVVWDGHTWTDHSNSILPAAVTGAANATLYNDAGIDHLVVLGGPLDDYGQKWMWTGVDWLQLATG